MKLIKFLLSFLFIFNFLYINGIPPYRIYIPPCQRNNRHQDDQWDTIDRNRRNNRNKIVPPRAYSPQNKSEQTAPSDQQPSPPVVNPPIKTPQEEVIKEDEIQIPRQEDIEKIAELLIPQCETIAEKYKTDVCSEQEQTRNIKRYKALDDAHNNQYQIEKRNYSLDDSFREFLLSFNMYSRNFKSCEGNAVQQLIHTECIDIVFQATEIDVNTGIPETVVRYADLAIDLNNKKELVKAFSLTDFCYNVLDVGKLFANACIDSFTIGGRELQPTLLQLPILFNDFAEEYLGEYIPTIKNLRIAYLDKESYDELILKLKRAIERNREARSNILSWDPKQLSRAMDIVWVRELQENFQNLDLKKLGALGLAWLSSRALEGSYAAEELSLVAESGTIVCSIPQAASALKVTSFLAGLGSTSLMLFSVYSDNFKNKIGNNQSDYKIGANGPKVDSKSFNIKKGLGRIDIENPAPGKVTGKIHLHYNNTKWHFDILRKVFYDLKTKIDAPGHIQKLLENKEIQNSINKALKYLGEPFLF